LSNHTTKHLVSDNDEQPSIKNLKIINYLLSMDEESGVITVQQIISNTLPQDTSNILI